MYWKALFPSKDDLAQKYQYIQKYPILLPMAWLHRLFFRGSKAVKNGALTTYMITDEQNMSAEGKKRIQMFRKLEMMK